MRIDLNPAAAAPLSGKERANGPSGNNEVRPATSSPLGEDQAQLFGDHTQIQALAAKVSELPDVREEKVNALRQAVSQGSYQPNSSEIAGAVFAHMVATTAA